MCIFASALYIKLGKQLILLYFKTMQNSDSVDSDFLHLPQKQSDQFDRKFFMASFHMDSNRTSAKKKRRQLF